MLFVDAVINGLKIKVFVDSGAQASLISRSCAQRCGLARLVDDRFKGLAVGVGQASTLGRIHSTHISFCADKQVVLVCSLVVMDMPDGVEMLLGLDMLKRHQMVIDLSKNALVIHGHKASFLPEGQCPRLHQHHNK